MKLNYDFAFKQLLASLIYFISTFCFSQNYYTSALSDPAPVYEQGLSVSINGSFELVGDSKNALLGSQTFTLQFASFVGGVNTIYGIQYRGKVYHDYSFDGALKEYFAALKVRGISYSIDVTGLKDASCRTFTAVNVAPGNKNSRFCEPTGEPIRIDDIRITRVFLDGVGNLQRKIDELEREAERRKKEEEERIKKEEADRKELERLEKLAKKKEALEKAEKEKMEKIKQEQQEAEILNTQKAELENKKTLENEAAEERRQESLRLHQEHLDKMNEIYNSPEAINLRAKMMQAKALEAEGDQLWSMGSFYAFQAYQKYEEAQKIYYSQQVQSKMNEIGGYVQLAQGLSSLGNIITEELDEITELLDPQSKTSWSHLGLYHAGPFKNIGDINSTAPSSTYLVMAMNFLAISLDLRASYHVLPVQSYSIYRQGWNLVMPEVATVATTAYGMGYTIGLNIPFKYVQFYGNYGNDYLFPDKTEVYAPNYYYDGVPNPGDEKKLTRYIFGINFQIPKSHFGFGVSYNLFTLSGGDTLSFLNELVYTGTESNRATSRGLEYHLYENLSENYKFNNFGVNIFYRFSPR